MKKRRVWRYKCDFCKKANCSSASITKHEQGCTNNPNRTCGVCAVIKREGLADRPPMPLAESRLLLPLLPDDDAALDLLMEGNGSGSQAEKYLEQLRAAVNYCPACTLAAIRQSPPNSIAQYLRFDYKSASKAFWEEINSSGE
jgi:hypothetical protein